MYIILPSITATIHKSLCPCGAAVITIAPSYSIKSKVGMLKLDSGKNFWQ